MRTARLEMGYEQARVRTLNEAAMKVMWGDIVGSTEQQRTAEPRVASDAGRMAVMTSNIEQPVALTQS